MRYRQLLLIGSVVFSPACGARSGFDLTNAEQMNPNLIRTPLAAGEDYTCAIRGDGTVRCWGNGDLGQLGNGSEANSSVPTTVSGIGNVAALAAAWVDTCALQNDGTIRCWGLG